MDKLDVLYVIAAFCLLLAVVSAYLIYQYVQEERKVAAKMKLKKEFEQIDPSTYAVAEASYRTGDNKDKNKKDKTKEPKHPKEPKAQNPLKGPKANGKAGKAALPVGVAAIQGVYDDGGWEEGGEEWERGEEGGPHGSGDTRAPLRREGGVPRGPKGSFQNDQKVVTIGGAVVVGAAVGATAAAVASKKQKPGPRGQPAPSAVAPGAAGPRAMAPGAAGPRAMAPGAAGPRAMAPGPTRVNETAPFNPGSNIPQAATVGRAAVVGAAVVGTTAAIVAKDSKKEKKKSKKEKKNSEKPQEEDDNDLRLNLYNDTNYDTVDSEANPMKVVAPTAMIVAAASNTSSRHGNKAENFDWDDVYDLDQNVPRNVGPPPGVPDNTFHVLNENADEDDDDEKPRRKKKKKKTAQLLIPVESAGDFDDYQAPPKEPQPPPPDPARYDVPTPLMEQDRLKIRTDFRDRGQMQPRVSLTTGMDF